uniref:SCP domain-containing protein n=1 Tax=Panagrolaimus sp. JU765 TaxID=591449 RepID=A0AC34RIY1_9BILA
MISPEQDDEDDSFEQQFLQAHNEYRKKHGVPELTLNQELSEQAKNWAEKLATRQYMAYCELNGIGENITFFPAHMKAQEIVDYWYNEHKKYEFETPGWQTGTNYFTQIIWRSTKEIGVGRKIMPAAECENGSLKLAKPQQNGTTIGEDKQIVVAFYRPAGNSNRAGQFALNVQKPINNH